VNGTCAPDRDELPARAIAGVECRPESDLVRHVGLYLFESQEVLLDTYFQELAVYGISPRSEAPDGSFAEGGWIPGDGVVAEFVPERQTWFLDRSGTARYMATLPPFVLVSVDGRTGDAAALSRWPWLGNADQPGAPTIWRSSGPASPEK
jgi:hypothetical protein